MATKRTNRSMMKREQGLDVETRKYLNKAKMDAYYLNYSKVNYRTIGFKLNVNKPDEAKVLAYLDYQPGLKQFMLEVITRHMDEHPDIVEKALKLEEATRELAEESEMPVKAGDVVVECESCGLKSTIKRKSYFEKPEKLICPICGEELKAINPPSSKENPNLYKDMISEDDITVKNPRVNK